MSSAFIALNTSSHAAAIGFAHSIRTGSRFPPLPCRNGSGNEPTTAGTRIAAPQSWRSHQIRSPGCRRTAAAPCDDSIPLT